ncbi:MAG TPA: RluA family pseudouridine synthase [Saprospiraceae bacterium]|nr:RluA family pseudouridine synthase [Saprospiraceae bacterium]HPI08616.1 RluA family pseudouridine synthase [Saprospiraceae bacterium]
MLPSVIFEDNHLLVLNKPAGWLVQADRTGDVTLTDWGKDYLKEKYNKPGAVFLHPVHRIDRPVSGAVIFARTDKALGRLTTLFREKKVQKFYFALTIKAPNPQEGKLKHFLLKDEARNVVQAYPKPYRDAKESITHYETMGKQEAGYLLKITPLTGRPHQIRVQLSAIGCPILGDLKYGAPKALPDASIGLHCFQMELMHPVRQEPLVVEAPLPDGEWWRP